MASSEDVALWMQNRLEENGILRQKEVVHDIQERFGSEFVYLNDRGNLAIDRKVLRVFRRFTGDTAIWMRREHCWVQRREYHPQGDRSISKSRYC
jgi:hypothetical protein